MSEANALLMILEKTIENSSTIIQALERIAQKQDENALALAKAIGENTELIAKGIEENSQALAQLIATDSRALAQLVENSNRTLERIVATTDRTERMTAEILARLASVQGTSH